MKYKILEINLSNKSSTIEILKENLIKEYIGGKGLGLKLLFDRLSPKTEALSAENIIVITTGVLLGVGAPCSSRFSAVTKSPLTGIITTSSCGGKFGTTLKSAGLFGIIIKGASKTPIAIEINNEKVEFKDVSNWWGIDIKEINNKILDKKDKALTIGTAGENLVRFAGIACKDRFFGRGGIGAVMGYKKLKAIIVRKGDFKIIPKNEEKFNKLRKKANKFIQRNKISIKNQKFGTASNLKPINNANMLPIRNYLMGNHDFAFNLTGENIAKKHNTKFHTCTPCSIKCGHKGIFNNISKKVPEYETIVLLGANLCIFDIDFITELSEICDNLGMDTMSAGITIAWAMEASEKGLIQTNLKFGSKEGIKEILYDMASRNGLGADMSKGVRFLSNKYGGKDFAMHIKGLEMAAYDPRGSFGQGLSYAVANRGGCHLSAFLVSLEVFFNLLKRDTSKAKPEFVKFLEDLTCLVNSVSVCQFTMYAYTLEPWLTKLTPKPILGYLMQNFPKIAIFLFDYSLYTDFFNAVTGFNLSSRDFIKAGERIHILERYMNTLEGISKKDDTLPKRMVNESRETDNKNLKVPLSRMLERYYKKRGYNQNGIPKQKLLKKLNIDITVKD